jgi:hypothetical protein
MPIISFEDALVLYALLTLCGRHGEAAWRGQHDTGRSRAAFRAGGRQIAFRHRSQLCERPALLAHVFVRRHRPPTSGQNTSAADRSVTINYTSWPTGLCSSSVIFWHGAPRRPARGPTDGRIDTPYVRGCLSNHAPSLTEARWTTLCCEISLRRGHYTRTRQSPHEWTRSRRFDFVSLS